MPVPEPDIGFAVMAEMNAAIGGGRRGGVRPDGRMLAGPAVGRIEIHGVAETESQTGFAIFPIATNQGLSPDGLETL